jgi:hypothetical protein
VGDVDTVFIDGRMVKRHGKLVGENVGAVMQRATKSRDYLFSKTGWHFDPFAE